jgi:hypothetical protein
MYSFCVAIHLTSKFVASRPRREFKEGHFADGRCRLAPFLFIFHTYLLCSFCFLDVLFFTRLF